ncbi:MAG TPA: polysaccharide biosynthesis tyrosine autokinase [Candidatus Pullilachnospira intestinigallinarum]|nr:polysaccharide biosynthesis tyrosine autokinase [Candidatus Pullilachnospira intestinigallinarum]
MSTEQRNTDDVIDLGALLWNFFRVLRRTWWLIPLLALLGGAAAFVRYSGFYTPMYRSTASFTVMTGSSETDSESYNFYYDSATAGQLAKTFPYILSSNLLTDAIEADLGVESINGSISAEAVSDSNLITMTVISSDPEDARDILESAIRVYPSVARFVIGETRFNMIDVPTLPTEPYNQPNDTRQIAKWALAGVAAALAGMLFMALLKKTVQRPEELKSVMSLPCLGNIPQVRFKARKKKGARDLTIKNGRLPQNFRESILSLQVRLDREMEERKGKVLLVTSTLSGEGKSMTAINLACAAAEHGKKVLLIDGDLRKQQDGQLLGAKSGKGLEQVLKSECLLEDALQKEKKSGVWMLCGSRPVSRVARLLSHRQMPEVMAACRKIMDLIVIDTPPCDPFEDAQIWSEYADGIVYVIRHDFVQKRRIVDGINGLEDGGTPILGYIFNDVPVHRGGYGYYGYGRYGYGYYGYGKYGYGKYGYGEGETSQKPEA